MAVFEKLEESSRFYLMLHPRPVVLVVSKCPNGRVNAMPASWLTPVSEEPPLLAVAVYKQNYTAECLEHSGEATINIPGVEHVDLVYRAGTVSGRGEDKVGRLQIRLESSPSISTPHWADAYGYIEARVWSRVDAGESWLYIFEVVAAHVRPESWSRWGWKAPPPIALHGSGRAFYKPGQMVLSRER